MAVDSGGKVTINDGIFSTYDLSGTGNNFHGLAVLADGHAVVNGGKFSQRRARLLRTPGRRRCGSGFRPSTVELKGGYFGDMGLDKIKGGTTITRQQVTNSNNWPNRLSSSPRPYPEKANTYKYRIVAQ